MTEEDIDAEWQAFPKLEPGESEDTNWDSLRQSAEDYGLYYAINPDGTTRRTNDIRAAFSYENKRVARTTVEGPQGSFDVSTVFLGLDHQYGDGPPLIFETMIFAHEGSQLEFAERYCERYSTIEQAREGHAVAVHLVEQALIED